MSYQEEIIKKAELRKQAQPAPAAPSDPFSANRFIPQDKRFDLTSGDAEIMEQGRRMMEDPKMRAKFDQQTEEFFSKMKKPLPASGSNPEPIQFNPNQFKK